MRIRYKRFAGEDRMPAWAFELMWLCACERIDLPSAIEVVDYTRMWAVVA